MIYVGDHEADAECAARTNDELKRRKQPVRVVSVGADYGRSEGPEWTFDPDCRARAPSDIVGLVRRLQAGHVEPVTSE